MRSADWLRLWWSPAALARLATACPTWLAVLTGSATLALNLAALFAAVTVPLAEPWGTLDGYLKDTAEAAKAAGVELVPLASGDRLVLGVGRSIPRGWPSRGPTQC